MEGGVEEWLLKQRALGTSTRTEASAKDGIRKGKRERGTKRKGQKKRRKSEA